MNENLPPQIDTLLTPIITVAQQVAKLQGSVDEGFKGVHLRQDIANGRTAKLETRIMAIEVQHKSEEGVIKGVKISWSFIVTVLTILIGFAGVIAYLVK